MIDAIVKIHLLFKNNVHMRLSCSCALTLIDLVPDTGRKEHGHGNIIGECMVGYNCIAI